MPWGPPIRCVGRRYPDAPLHARTACLERPPPFYFFIKSFGYDGNWPDEGEKMPLRWFDWQLNTTGGDPINSWNWFESGGQPEDLRINLNSWRHSQGGCNLELQFRMQSLDEISWNADYEKHFDVGFPKWPDFYDLTPQFINNWAYGPAPPTVRLYIGLYSEIPTGSCISSGE